MNTLGYVLNLVGWQMSQVNAHAKALLGTVNTAEDLLQGGSIDFTYDFSQLNSLEEAPLSEIR